MRKSSWSWRRSAHRNGDYPYKSRVSSNSVDILYHLPHHHHHHHVLYHHHIIIYHTPYHLRSCRLPFTCYFIHHIRPSLFRELFSPQFPTSRRTKPCIFHPLEHAMAGALCTDGKLAGHVNRVQAPLSAIQPFGTGHAPRHGWLVQML